MAAPFSSEISFTAAMIGAPIGTSLKGTMKPIPSGHTKTCAIFTLTMKATTGIAILFATSGASPAGLANA